MNILCLDFGLKRIGVAFAEGGLSEPIGVILNDAMIAKQSVGPKALSAILQYVSDLHIEKILVGIPEGPIEGHARGLGQLLTEKSGVPVEYIDETLTSHEAQLKASKQKKSRRERPQDHLAAAIMLQEYLDLL